MRAPTASLAIAHVYPDHAVSAEHPAHFPEHVDQSDDELGRGFFEADMAFYAIVTQIVVGRAATHGCTLSCDSVRIMSMQSPIYIWWS